mmetsp:Transcript_14871/g.38687  ORF Transcript_14871/g.38687 Transcript_14871/m.38687 type:complete len:118 (-) Transcript_14871:47-400(-)
MAGFAPPTIVNLLGSLNEHLERALQNAAAVLELLARGDETVEEDLKGHLDVFIESLHAVQSGIRDHAPLMDAVDTSRSGDIAAYRDKLAPARSRLYLAHLRARTAASDLHKLRVATP